MERSKELKDLLAENLNEERVTSETQSRIEEGYLSLERTTQLKAQLEEAKPELAKLTTQFEQFKTMQSEMSNEEFDALYQDLQAQINQIKKIAGRYSDEEMQEENRFCLMNFVSREEVTGFKSFIDKWAMQWMPTKQEIARLLAIAVEAHKERLAKGEINNDDPVTIVDLGGANGLLPKLIADLARENNINVNIQIVDPDTSTIEQAANHYKDEPNITFHNVTAAEWTLELHKNKPKIYELLKLREEKIAIWKKKLEDLGNLEDIIDNHYDNNDLSFEDLKNLAKVFLNDFGVELPEQYQVSTQQEFDECNFEDFSDDIFFIDKYRNDDEEPSVKEKIQIKMKGEIKAITIQIEELLKDEACEHDLAINSWMLVRNDFTKDVRATNASAITYMIERYGATGTQINAPYSEQPNSPGEENSYETGQMYQMDAAWIGPSVPELSKLQDGNLHRYGMGNESLCNGVIVQTKKTYPKHLTFNQPSASLIKPGDPYPWEKKMKQFHKLDPVVLRFESGKDNYHSLLNECESLSSQSDY